MHLALVYAFFMWSNKTYKQISFKEIILDKHLVMQHAVWTLHTHFLVLWSISVWIVCVSSGFFLSLWIQKKMQLKIDLFLLWMLYFFNFGPFFIDNYAVEKCGFYEWTWTVPSIIYGFKYSVCCRQQCLILWCIIEFLYL